MQKKLTMACSALLIVLPSLAFAQTPDPRTPGAGTDPATSLPSVEQSKTPASGTSEGRSSSTYATPTPNKPNVDGLHPGNAEIRSRQEQ